MKLYTSRSEGLHKSQHTQGVPLLVAQKLTVVTSELEVTVWSDTFQKLRPVLKV